MAASLQCLLAFDERPRRRPLAASCVGTLFPAAPSIDWFAYANPLLLPMAALSGYAVRLLSPAVALLPSLDAAALGRNACR